MEHKNRLVLFGHDNIDFSLYEKIASKLNLVFFSMPAQGVFGFWERLPKKFRNPYSKRLAEIASPWYDALKICFFTNKNDIILIRNIRSSIIYLWLVSNKIFPKRTIIITWFTLKKIPPKRWRPIYKTALQNAGGIFVYSPSEPSIYAGWFNVSESLFFLNILEAPILPLKLKIFSLIYYDVFMGGETNRDWITYCEVVRKMPHLRFVAVLSDRDASNLENFYNLVVFKNLEFENYCALIKQSLLQIILVRDQGVAVGQRDLLLAGRLGMPLIATALEAMVFYNPNKDAICFVPELDISLICESINRFMLDDNLRKKYAENLQLIVYQNHSHDAVIDNWVNYLLTLPDCRFGASEAHQ